jgi:hypothetical protein
MRMNFSLFRFRSPVFNANSPVFLCLPIAVTVLGLAGCEESKPRTYAEVAFKPLAAPMAMAGGMGAAGMPAMNASPVDIKVTWELPESWRIKDSANAMRIGSFAASDPSLANMGEADPQAVDVSVVQLGGDAGGLKANIGRWMGQVGIKATPEEMDELIKTAAHFKTKSGQDGMFVDLTDKLSGDMTQSRTIFGAVVQTADYTVFVKGIGDITKVVVQKPIIMAFCKSLKIEGPKS